MALLEDLLEGKTFAQARGLTSGMAVVVRDLAYEQLDAGRPEVARDLLQGLTLTNPHDAVTWLALAIVERRLGSKLAAAVCADVALRLAPEDAWVRLARAELLLATPGCREEARAAVRAIATLDGRPGAAARALLAALGERNAART